jgi:60S ribosomal protein uL30
MGALFVVISSFMFSLTHGFSEPNLKTVRELIYKRGYGKVHRQRVPLSNNSVIENALGKYDILSVEDLVHEIFTVGPNFKQVRLPQSRFVERF